MRKYLALPLIIAAVLLLIACSSTAESTGDQLDGTTWELYAYRKSKPISGTTITVNFEDGRLRGSAGCNTYAASYEVSENELMVDDIEITEMGCMEPEGVMEQEIYYIEFLRAGRRFTLSDEQLMIFRPDGEALTFVPSD